MYVTVGGGERVRRWSLGEGKEVEVVFYAGEPHDATVDDRMFGKVDKEANFRAAQDLYMKGKKLGKRFVYESAL